jgi:hypothetical protein
MSRLSAGDRPSPAGALSHPAFSGISVSGGRVTARGTRAAAAAEWALGVDRTEKDGWVCLNAAVPALGTTADWGPARASGAGAGCRSDKIIAAFHGLFFSR